MKTAFAIINIFLVAAMAYFCVDMIYKNALTESFMLPDEKSLGTISANISPPQTKPFLSKNQYDIIVTRNLFQVEVEEKEEPLVQGTEDKESEKLEATNLELVLWGTVTGDSEVYAVIEDKKIRQQSLYQIGDSIQGAKIKKILRHEVIITYQGKDQVLEMEADDKIAQKFGGPSKNTSQDTAPVNSIIDNNSVENLGGLMKQIKFRPHFTEGEPDGLMVYGIRPNSVFRQMGLRNGDIVKDINGTQIVSAEDASSLFTEVEGADNARVTLFRRGQVKELFYQVKEGQHSFADAPADVPEEKEIEPAADVPDEKEIESATDAPADVPEEKEIKGDE